MKYQRMNLDNRISNFVDASIEAGYAGRDYLTRKEIAHVMEVSGLVFPRWLAYNQSVDGGRQIGRAKFSFPELAEASTGVANVSPGHGTEGDDLNDLADMDTAMTVEDDMDSLIATSDDMMMLASDDALVMTDEDKIALGIMS